jgi:cobalt-zinc-cadmium resistance protein CzcA
VKKKVEELNDPASGRRLPSVEIEPYYDREDLIHVATETVTENLLVGIGLVVMILFMFLSNVRRHRRTGRSGLRRRYRERVA